MILGIGSDLCNIERIQASVDRFGDRFLNRVFTDVERANINTLGSAAAEAVVQAILRAVKLAKSMGGIPGLG